MRASFSSARLHSNLYDIGFPKARPDQLPSRYQHTILNCMQILLEEVLFYYAQRWAPRILKAANWDGPHCGELHRWWDRLKHERLPAISLHFAHGVVIEQVFKRVALLRHSAVHRLSTPTDILKRMNRDAIVLAGGLGDMLRQKKLLHLEQALHNNDLDLLQKYIDMPAKDFQLLPVDKASAQEANGETTITNPLRLRSQTLNSQPPVGPDASRPYREDTNKHGMHLRRRSASPLRVSDPNKPRDTSKRAASRRHTTHFIDLTKDDDDDDDDDDGPERTVVTKTRTQLQTMTTFIDLTVEEY